MKIVHLSTSNSSGAFSAAFKIHKLCKDFGYDSKFYCQYESTSSNKDENTFIESNSSTIVYKLKIYFRKLFKNHLIKSEKSLLAYYSFFQFNDVKKYGINKKLVNKIVEADILFVHWVTNFVNIRDIHHIQKQTNCRVIFTMMDMVHITGGCHYAQDCTLFKTNCINCPALKYDLKPIPYIQLLNKSSIISSFKSEIIAFSKQNLKDAINSKIKFNKYHQLTLPYDDKIYKPLFTGETIKKNKSFNILGSAFTVLNERKGPSYLFETMVMLDKMLTKNNCKVNLYHIDLNFEENYSFQNIKFVKFNYIKSEIELNEFYNLIDLFIFTSVADAAPQMMAECLLAGTPVVSFNTGNASDIIDKSIDGFVVDKYDCIALAKNAFQIIVNAETWRSNRRIIHERAKKNHSIDKFNSDLNSIINCSF